MKEPVENLIKDLSFHQPINEAQWKQIVTVFEQANKEEARLLLKTLGQYAGIAPESMQSFLNSSTKSFKNFSRFNELQTQFFQLNEQFKDAVNKKFPKLALAYPDISNKQWFKLYTIYRNEECQNLTGSFIFRNFPHILGENYSTFLNKITEHGKERSCKNSLGRKKPGNTKIFQPANRSDDKENRIIADPDNTCSTLLSPLRATGVTFKKLVNSSPICGYTNVKETPDGTKVRSFYSNSNLDAYTPITPLRTINNYKGMFFNEQAKSEDIERKLPKVKNKQAKQVHQAITLQQIESCRNQRRTCGQKTLFKASAAEIFNIYGVDINYKIEGKEHHLAHIIGLILGGRHIRKNLFPSTAAANYNTLELIEIPIIKLLETHADAWIDLDVTFTYAGESLVPDLVSYEITMKKMLGNEEKILLNETHHINPRSYQRVTPMMKESLKRSRDLDEEEEQESCKVPRYRL